MKVYNEIFEHRLKPCAFRVYLYLSGTFCKRGSKGRVKIETIALRCNMSISNIKRALEELQHKKLIQKCECWGYIPSNGKQLRRRLANEYIIKPLSGGFWYNKSVIENTEKGIDNCTYFYYTIREVIGLARWF